MLQHITVVSGFRACGKSKLCEIIVAALNGSKKIRYIDMSDAIKYFMARPQMPIGKELQQHLQTMEAGGVIMDGHLIYTLCLGYLRIRDHEEGVNTEHLILAGGFRTETEAHCFMQCGVPITIIHITGNKDDMFTGVNRRLKAGVNRPDSMSPEKLERGWNDYETLTKPVLKLGNKSRYHEIDFNMSMRGKVNACIDVMELPPGVKAKMKRRIKSGNHPARIQIEALDHPKPKQHEPRPAHSAVDTDRQSGNSSVPASKFEHGLTRQYRSVMQGQPA